MKLYRKSTIQESFGDCKITYRYHATDIVEFCSPMFYFLEKATVVLRTSGWRTVSTKRNINQILDHYGVNARVYAKEYTWYITHNGVTEEFREGHTLYLKPEEQITLRDYLRRIDHSRIDSDQKGE